MFKAKVKNVFAPRQLPFASSCETIHRKYRPCAGSFSCESNSFDKLVDSFWNRRRIFSRLRMFLLNLIYLFFDVHLALSWQYTQNKIKHSEQTKKIYHPDRPVVNAPSHLRSPLLNKNWRKRWQNLCQKPHEIKKVHWMSK